MSAWDLGPMARQRQRHYAGGSRRARFSQASRWALKADETLKKKDATTYTGATQQGSKQAADKNAIRPFHVDVPEAELTELRRRIKATKWPERETVTDQSQRVQLATIQKLARYWARRQ